jgi:hypothetical protein
MARTWRTERTTPKEPRKATPRPRKGEFSRQVYEDQPDTVTRSSIPLCCSPLDCLRDCDCGTALAYLEADS